MNEIFFLLFAFFTVFLSIRLSYYVDYLSKHSKVNGAVLAGVFLAAVTSLPELVTCFSAVFVDNYLLAVGDILGSNIFNIFMICVFDLFYIKKAMFINMKKKHSFIFALLLINYIILYLFVGNISVFNVGIPSLCILVSYAYYLFRMSTSSNDFVKINDYSCEHVVLKLIVTAILMIFSSIILTIIVNKLAILHPYFSSSFLGAIFLGVTTSLPEVITCYTLISINSYDLALDDIIGSNFFNLLVIAIVDLFLKKASIFSYSDSGVIILIILGFVFTMFSFINVKKLKLTYGLISFLIVVIYLGYWIINFLG